MRKFPIQYLILLVFLGTITELIARDPVMIVRCRGNAKIAFSENPPKRLKMMDGCDCPAGYAEEMDGMGEIVCGLIPSAPPVMLECSPPCIDSQCYPVYEEGTLNFLRTQCFAVPPDCGECCGLCVYTEVSASVEPSCISCDFLDLTCDPATLSCESVSSCPVGCPEGERCNDGTCESICGDCPAGTTCAKSYTFSPEEGFEGPSFRCVPNCSSLDEDDPPCIECPVGFSLNWVTESNGVDPEFGECSCTPDGMSFGDDEVLKIPTRSSHDIILEQFNIANKETKSESVLARNNIQNTKRLKKMECASCPLGTIPGPSIFCGVEGNADNPPTCVLPPLVDCAPASASYTRNCGINISETIEIEFTLPPGREGGTVTIADLVNCEVADGFGGLFGEFGQIQAAVAGTTNSIGLMDLDGNGIVTLTVNVDNPTLDVIVKASGLMEDFVIPPCPSINDPCSCTNPNNMPLDDGSILFEEIITVTDVPSVITPVLSMNDGNFLMSNEMAYNDGTLFVPIAGTFDLATMTQDYELKGYTRTNTPAGVKIEIGTSVNNFETKACACDEAIPTLGEWGLMCLMLIFMIIGIVSLKQTDYQIMLVKRK